MRHFFLFLSLSLFVSYSYGQILNIEKFRLDLDTSNALLGTINLSYSTKKQKTSVSEFGGGVNLIYLSKQHSYMLLSKSALVRVANERVVSEGFAHLRNNFFRKKKVSLEQFNQIQYDVGRGLELRLLSGIGGRMRLINGKKGAISLSTGAMFEHEEWLDERILINDYVKSSSSLSVRYELLKNVNLITISYYQARFETFFKPRITVDASLLVKINKKLSLRNQFVLTYDAAPVIDIAELIYSFKSGLTYKF